MNKLQELNASIAVLNQKLNNIHFNYKGENFRDVHLFTEEMYKIGLELYDDVSEKIAMQDIIVKASFTEHLEQSKVKELKGIALTNKDVSETIVKDLTTILNLIEEMDNSTTIQPIVDEVAMWADKYRWIFKSMK